MAWIAVDILRRGAGARLATAIEYQRAIGVGSGTIQKALRRLEASRSVSVRARGHQGTFVSALDVGSLWRAAGLGAARVVMTPPGAVEGHGLAQGLRAEFRRLSVPLEFDFTRGARERLRRVERRDADLAVISQGAAASLRSAERTSFSFYDLGPDTYYAPTSIVRIARGDADSHPPSQRRVGIDRRSFDHEALTTAEFPESEGNRYVEADFVTLPAAVLDGRIDAGLWHRLSTIVPLRGLDLRVDGNLRAETRRVLAGLSGAHILWLGERREFETLFASVAATSIRNRVRRLVRLDPDSDELRSKLWLL
jgi:hypothetical protein